jgi:hypothetical protein
LDKNSYDFGQHLAQPAASVQHLAQVVGFLQQPPSQPMADLPLASLLVVEQPVAIKVPTAQTSANIIIFISCLWLFVIVKNFIF